MFAARQAAHTTSTPTRAEPDRRSEAKAPVRHDGASQQSDLSWQLRFRTAGLAGAAEPGSTPNGDRSWLAGPPGGDAAPSPRTRSWNLHATGSGGTATLEAPAEVRRVAERGGGRALPEPLRAVMQAHLGYDFSRVRVHDDAAAGAAARAVDAVAYTIGTDIVFAPGAYQPGTSEGLHLVAHELSHVVQQHGSRTDLSMRLEVGPVDDPSERDADRAADAVLRGEIVSPQRVGLGRVRRLQRQVSERCLPPSAWFVLGGPQNIPAAVAFGAIAETFISASVVATNGIAFGNFYLDNPLAGPIDPLLVAFILAKNPSLSLLQQAKVVGTVIARPDVLMHQAPIFEFEEVKPNSTAGRAAGRAKVRVIDVFYTGIPLPYRPGITYTPPPPFVIVDTTVPVPVVGPVPLKVSFRVTRNRSGLLVYDICVETDWLKAALTIIAIVILIILALISRGAIKPVPVPVPVPAPVPVPVPAFGSAAPAQGAGGLVGGAQEGPAWSDGDGGESESGYAVS